MAGRNTRDHAGVGTGWLLGPWFVTIAEYGSEECFRFGGMSVAPPVGADAN